MSGISDIGTRLSQQYALGVLRNDLTEVQRQSSSGKKSNTINGLGTLGTSHAVNFRSSVKLLDTYTANLNYSKTRFAVTDRALTSITDAARDVSTQLRTQLQDTNPKAAISANLARDKLDSIMLSMNSQLESIYIFAGDDLNNKPVNNPATLHANMSALVTGWMTGTTVDNVVNDARGITGTGLGVNSGTLAADTMKFRGADDTNIEFKVKADQQGFADITRGLAIIANLPQPTTPVEQDNYWNIVNGVIKLIDEGTRALDTTQGILGTQAKIVDELLVQHNENQAAFETFIGEVEDVDMAEAAMKFSALQTQLQTSYSIISSTHDLSLVKYL